MIYEVYIREHPVIDMDSSYCTQTLNIWNYDSIKHAQVASHYRLEYEVSER